MLKPSKYPLLGYVLKNIELPDVVVPQEFVEVNLQPEVGDEAYKKGAKIAVSDDAGYLMTAKFMAGHRQAKGNSQFDLYNEIGDNFYSLIKFANDELPGDMIVYMTMHEEMNDMGYTKPKTIGKLLDDKVCIEGLFTIVLHALKLDGKYQFATNTDGLDVTKSPIGMFDTEYIDNDLQLVTDKIREYYK